MVIAIAVAYFLLTWNRTLSTYDGGYLLYNFDKFARGQLPHRDFYDIYGAITYFLGGSLFRLFGTKILVIRAFVVLLKAFMAVLIFRIGCRLVPRGLAFLGSILFILYWGDALDLVFNAPYGGHCAHFLALLGILSMIFYLEREKLRWILAAGFCSGLVLLFKLSTGAFILIGFGLFLSLKEQVPILTEQCEDESLRRDNRFILISRLAKLAIIVGTALVFVLYLSRFQLDVYYFVVFLLPLFLLLGFMLVREVSIFRRARSGKAHAVWPAFKGFIGEAALLSVGPICLWLLQVLFYYRAGGLEEMLYDTFVLPFAINYYWPLSDRRLHTILIVVAVLAYFFALSAGRYRNGTSRTAMTLLFSGVLALLLAPVAYVLITGTPVLTWRARAIHVFSTSVLLMTFPALLTPKEDNAEAVKRKLVLSLCYVFACLFLIMAFPRSDESHFMLNSTVIFALAALALQRLGESGKLIFGIHSRIPGGVWVAAAMVPIVFPLLLSMKLFHLYRIPQGAEGHTRNRLAFRPTFELKSPRAQGLRLHVSKQSVDLDKTVEFVREHSAPDERIFVICGEQVIYFLSERDTMLPKENYFTYLSNFRFVDSESDMRLTDRQIVQALIEKKPRFVIQKRNDQRTQDFLATWPRTDVQIRLAYSRVAEFGQFQILELRGSKIVGEEHP